MKIKDILVLVLFSTSAWYIIHVLPFGIDTLVYISSMILEFILFMLWTKQALDKALKKTNS